MLGLQQDSQEVSSSFQRVNFVWDPQRLGEGNQRLESSSCQQTVVELKQGRGLHKPGQTF